MTQGYSAAHYRRLANGGPDAPGDASRRVADRKAGERAHAEMLEKFSPLTAENALEALRWQEARWRELMSE